MINDGQLIGCKFLSLFQQGKDLKAKVVFPEPGLPTNKFLSLFQQGKDLKWIIVLSSSFSPISVSIPFSAGQRLKDRERSLT